MKKKNNVLQKTDIKEEDLRTKRYLIFNGGFNEKEVAELIEKFEIIFSSYNEDDVVIKFYFSSVGGEVTSAEMLANYINQNKYKIEVYARREIHSVAFLLFKQIKCKKFVLFDTCALLHVISQQIPVFYGVNKNINYYLQGAEMELLKEIIEKQKNIFKTFLLEEELEKAMTIEGLTIKSVDIAKYCDATLITEFIDV